MKSNRVFVSYRRSGGVELATLIRSALQDRGFEVFMDFEDLRTGPFNTALLKAIEESAHVLVILTPGSLDRCENEDDWVRLEVSHALRSEKNVVPILATGFTWPSQLPTDIAPLRNLHGLSPSHEFFEASMDKLGSLLRGKRIKKTPRAILSLVIVTASVAVVATVIYIGFRNGVLQPALVNRSQETGSPWIDLDYAMLEPCTPEEGTLVADIVETCNGGNWSARYEDGQLVFENLKEEGDALYYRFNLGDGQKGSHPMSVDARVIPNDQSRGFVGAGLQYQFNLEALSYYGYCVTAGGELVFMRKTPEAAETLFVSSPNYVNPNATVRLGIIPSGEGFALYCDEKLVKVVIDEHPLPKGIFGVLAVGPGKFYLDNIAVYEATTGQSASRNQLP